MADHRTLRNHDSVYALIVCHGRHSDQRSVIEGVLAQTVSPAAVIVVTVGNDSATEAFSRDLSEVLADQEGPPAWVINIPVAKNFGEAIRQALTSDSITAIPQWYWLLHDDSCPEPDALRHLLVEGNRGGTIALVGPKHIDWDDGALVVEVGIEVTRSGRRAELLQHGEIDQGQYDGRQDVLAVGTAGMLMSGDIWHHVKGLDPYLGPFGDGLELGRRVRRAGYRVVVAPKARLRHRRASLAPDGDRQRSFRRRRAAQLYNWLLASSGLICAWLVLALAVWTPLRAFGRILTRKPRLAVAELGAYLDLFFGLAALGRARRRHRRLAQVPRSSLSELELTPRELQSRRASARRALRARPKDSDYIDPLAAKAWKIGIRQARWTLVTTIALLTVFSLFVWNPYSGGLTGGAWANLPTQWSVLWQQAWSPWVGGGDGAAGPVNSLLPLFAVLSAPFAVVGVNANHVALAILIAALPLAGLGGWAVASVLTRSLAFRVAAALLWAAQPGLLLSLTSGHLAAVVVWLALPLVLVSLWRATRPLPPVLIEGVRDVAVYPRPDSITWAGVGALALIVAASGAPIVLIPVGLVALLATVLPSGRIYASTRQQLTPLGVPVDFSTLRVSPVRRLLSSTVILVPALVVTAPTWVWGIGHVGQGEGVFAVMTDPTGASATPVPSLWQILASATVDVSGMWAWVSLAAGIVVALWALVAVVVTIVYPGPHPWVGRIVFVVGALAAAGAVVLAVDGWWVASLLAVAALSWIVTGLSLAVPVRLRAEAEKATWPQRLRSGGTVLLSASSLASLVLLLAAGLFDPPEGSATVRPQSTSSTPMVAAQVQASPRAARLLVVSPLEDRVHAQVWRGDGLQQEDLSAGLRLSPSESLEEARRDLAQAVGTVAARPSAVVAETFSQHAIDLILMPPDESDNAETLFGHLSASEGLERIGTTEAGTMWRVRPDSNLPARVTLVSNNGRHIIDSNAASVKTKLTVPVAGTIFLAESADPFWRATFAGKPLEPVNDSIAGWRQAFAVPTGEGILTITYSPPWRLWWLAASLVVGAAVVISALPWKVRRSVWVVVAEEDAEPEDDRE